MVTAFSFSFSFSFSFHIVTLVPAEGAAVSLGDNFGGFVRSRRFIRFAAIGAKRTIFPIVTIISELICLRKTFGKKPDRYVIYF